MKAAVSARRARDWLLDLVFPLHCLGCGREGGMLCAACVGSLPRVVQPVCGCCGAPVRQGTLCRHCADRRPDIDGVRSVLLYGGLGRRAIHEMKYRHLKAVAAPLGELLAGHLRAYPVPGDFLVPVPLHRKRLRERGYNQAALLARETGRIMGLPVREGWLARQRDTVTQARAASAAERRSNVREAFVCPLELHGERVLLIDDVCTTGATLDACASALKAAGAGPVWGLTVAREL